jgi:hypothetical protein
MIDLSVKRRWAALFAVLALASGAVACEGRVSGDVDRNEGNGGGENGDGAEGDVDVDVDADEGEGE